MYQTVFFGCSGSNVFTTLGALHELHEQEKIDKIKIWSTYGFGAIVLFMRCLGYTYFQICDTIQKFKYTCMFISNSNVLFLDRPDLEQTISTWILDIIKNKSKLFDENITLKEVFKLSGLFPNFIVWNYSNHTIDVLNPFNSPDLKLVSVVLACMCCAGVYDAFELNETVYRDIQILDVYPHEYTWTPLDKKETKILYVFNNCTGLDDTETDSGPLEDKQLEMISQFVGRQKFKMKHLPETTLMLHSKYYREKLSKELVNNLFQLGRTQVEYFIDNRDTKEVVV